MKPQFVAEIKFWSFRSCPISFNLISFDDRILVPIFKLLLDWNLNCIINSYLVGKKSNQMNIGCPAWNSGTTKGQARNGKWNNNRRRMRPVVPRPVPQRKRVRKAAAKWATPHRAPVGKDSKSTKISTILKHLMISHQTLSAPTNHPPQNPQNPSPNMIPPSS